MRRTELNSDGNGRLTAEEAEIVVETFGISDVGNVRAENEDHFIVADMEKSVLVTESSISVADIPVFADAHGQLLLVADGVGGHAGGERASRVAAEAMMCYVAGRIPSLLPDESMTTATVEQDIRSAMEFCHRSIAHLIASDPSLEGMGTTLTVGYLRWPNLFVGHVGDSRCYLQRRGKLQQITTDHTVAQQMVDIGELDASDALKSSFSHHLWNAIGGGIEELTPQVVSVELQPNDTVLLCTDGLPRHVTEDAIRNVLDAASSAKQACKWLIGAAKNGGGTDNVTAVVARLSRARQAGRCAKKELGAGRT